jgi:ribosomal protein S9
MEVVNTIGRRKTAVARIYLKEGKGNIIVNKKDYIPDRQKHFASQLHGLCAKLMQKIVLHLKQKVY